MAAQYPGYIQPTLVNVQPPLVNAQPALANVQPTLANNESDVVQRILEARNGNSQDIVGYPVRDTSGKQVVILKRCDGTNDYNSFFVQLSPVLSCQIYLQDSSANLTNIQNFLTSSAGNPIYLNNVQLGPGGGHYFQTPENQNQKGYGLSQGQIGYSISSQAFVDVKGITVDSVLHYDKLPSSLYLNVCGYVRWVGLLEEYPIPSRNGQKAPLRRATIESGGVMYHLVAWEHAIAAIDGILSFQKEGKGMQITAVHWYYNKYHERWQLETSYISQVELLL